MKEDLKRNLIAMAEAIVSFFGRNCEVAVHDISRMESSLVHIAGNVTNRKPGAPATDLLARHLAKYGDMAPDLPPYPSKNAAGCPMKSSLNFIRDKSGRIVAAVCFNMDISRQLDAIEMLENQVLMSGVMQNDKKETFSNTLSEASNSLVKDVLAEFGKHPQSLSREEKIELVKRFEAAGAFYFKGMVEDIARIMGISKYTLYSYRKIANDR